MSATRPLRSRPPEPGGRAEFRQRRRNRARALIVALVLAAMAGFASGWFARSLVPGAAPVGSAAHATETAPTLDLSRAVGTAGCPAPRAISTLPPGRRVVALTFDDGPSVDTTAQILRILADKHVHATFFETGEHTATHPDLVAAVAAAGHALGSHTWNHPHLPQIDLASVRDQVTRSTLAVSAASGRPVCLVRPPFGQSTPQIDATFAAQGLTKVMWTHNPIDWTNPTPAELRARSAPPKGDPPTILLLHEHGREDPEQVGPSATVAALPGIVDDYRARGYTFVQVDGRPFPGARP